MAMATGGAPDEATSGGVGRASRPPVLDLGLILQAFARSLPAAIGIGLAVGLLVALAYTTVRPTYTATTTVSVDTVAREERDAATMSTMAAGMSEFLTDARSMSLLENRSGEPVVVGGLRPTVEVTTSNIPGYLTVVTRSNSGPESALEMGVAVVDAMNSRADELREQSLASATRSSQREIDELNEQILTRQRAEADTSDLTRLVFEARSRLENLRAAYPEARVIAQNDSGGGPTWPKPMESGAVAGIVATLVAAAVLASLRIRRGRRADRVWARSVGYRYDSVVDVDVAPPGELPPLSEAVVSAVLSAGGTVVVLGELEPFEPPVDDQNEAARLLVTGYDSPWWRELPASGVDIGVVVVDLGASTSRAAEAGLATFREVGIPARVVVRKPETRN